MLESAVFDEGAVGDVRVVANHAVGEAEVEFRLWVEVSSAEENDVSKAFGGTVHAGYSIRVWVDASFSVSLVNFEEVGGFVGYDVGN